MNRRIFGIETEYGITCADLGPGARPVPAGEAAQRLFTPVMRHYRSSNIYWQNGGRLYLDVGSHPEYATAECDRVEDLVAQVRAGEQLFADLARAADQELEEEFGAGHIHLLRTNEDSQGNAFGCHENYLLRRSADFRRTATALVTLLVTRQIVAGAGHLLPAEDGSTRFGFSARARYMDEAISSATTRARPIINARDEPLADPGKYRRLHVIVSDTNVSESATALKVVIMDLALSALEQGLDVSDLALADPLQAIRDIDAAFPRPALVTLESGKHLPASEIQWRLREKILAAVDTSAASPLAQEMIDLWGRAIEAVDSGNWQAVETELDWAIKYRLLDRARQRHQVDWDSPLIARLELAYHDITGQVLAHRLETSGAMRRLTTPSQVAHAMRQPPATTRAHLRGAAIRAAWQQGVMIGADWSHLRCDEVGARPVTLNDPFATSDPAVDELIERIYTTEDTTAGFFA